MSGASAAKTHWKKAMKFTLALFFRGFNSSKCKTAAKLAVARIKLLRNKREVVVKQMRRDIAMLLQSGQDGTARIRVEHVMREQNIMAANEFIELFCELIVSRLSIIAKQRECPADLKEGISSLIFAAPRCSEIPELLALRDIFEKKYGKDFVSAATDLRPNCGVNRMLIDKLSVRTPVGELKLKVMKEIAKEYQVEWDTTESETELLKPPEKHIEGPCSFVSASSLPVQKSMSRRQSFEPNNSSTRYSDSSERNNPMQFENTKSAAEAAAESAKQAIAAAEAAAYLASKDSNEFTQSYGHYSGVNGSKGTKDFNPVSGKYTKTTMNMDNQKFHRRHSYNVPSTNSGIKLDDSDCDEEIEMDDPTVVDLPPKRPTDGTDDRKMYRRHSYNNPPGHSSVKFDESDCDEEVDEEIEMGQPPTWPAPQLPSAHVKQVHRVHPKLPDYDAFAARFEALKNRKSQT